jgi:nitroreductase
MMEGKCQQMEVAMDILEAILTRRSIRQYQDKPVSEELIRKLLAAAMSAPSARNSQPWRFVVIDDRSLLEQVPAINPYAAMARQAPVAILICADPSLEKSPGYWMLDCAAAAENLLLAAHGLGLGAVWCGVYPRQPRIDGFRRLLGVPEEIVPHSLIVLGYPAETRPAEDRYQPDRVRRNRWTLTKGKSLDRD